MGWYNVGHYRGVPPFGLGSDYGEKDVAAVAIGNTIRTKMYCITLRLISPSLRSRPGGEVHSPKILPIEQHVASKFLQY